MKLYPIGSTCGCYFDDETMLAHICRKHYNMLMSDSDIHGLVDMECDLVTTSERLTEIFGIPVIEDKMEEKCQKKDSSG